MRFMTGRSGALHHARDRGRDAMPIRGFLFERAPTQRAEPVELRAPVVLRRAPGRAQPAADLETMQRRIERPFLDAQHVVGRTLNSGNDAVAMHLAATEDFENQRSEEHTSELQS